MHSEIPIRYQILKFISSMHVSNVTNLAWKYGQLLFICKSFKPPTRSSRLDKCCFPQRRRIQVVASRVTSVNETAAKIVNASWLVKQLKSGDERGPNVTILDVRGRVMKCDGRVQSGFQRVKYVADDEAFADEHVPTANFVDWRNVDLSQKRRIRDDMIRCGVIPTKPVCIYDWGDMLFASRLWLALVSLGCVEVNILDGGWASWKANKAICESYDQTVSDVENLPREGTECTVESSSPIKKCGYTSQAISEWIATAESDSEERLKESVSLADMRKIVAQLRHENDGLAGNEKRRSRIASNKNDNNAEFIIFDARSAKQFDGIEVRSSRGGHIPGAINVPYRLLLKDDGRGLRPDAELRQILKQSGADAIWNKSKKAVCYCNGGVASSLLLFCLVRCGAGWGSVQNYCGSFNEWGNLMDTPIVNVMGKS